MKTWDCSIEHRGFMQFKFQNGVQVANRGHIGIEQTLTSKQQRGDQPTRMSNKVTKRNRKRSPKYTGQR